MEDTWLNFFEHRSQDFEFLFDGVMGIMEQQTSTSRNPLPGAKKSLTYITETCESRISQSICSF